MNILAMAAVWLAWGGQLTNKEPVDSASQASVSPATARTQGSMADRPFMLPPYQFRNPNEPTRAVPQTLSSGNCVIPLHRYAATVTMDPQMQKKQAGNNAGDIKVMPALPVCPAR